MGYATDVEKVGGTRLGGLSVPHLNEINLDPPFQTEAITKAAFKKVPGCVLLARMDYHADPIQADLAH